MQRNYKQVQVVLSIILVANLLVAVLKTILGYVIRSSSMLADGIHSFSDGASNVIGLVGIQLAKKTADENHPYGHEKIEMLSSSIIGLLLGYLGLQILWRGVVLFRNPIALDVRIESLIVLFVTLCFNIFISTWEAKKGKLWNSPILISDAKHTRSDIYVSTGVFVSLLGMKLGLSASVDALMSCVVSLFILHAAWKVLRDNVGVLLDSQVLEIEKIRGVVLKFPEVREAHKIRTRGSLAHVYVDMHILVRNNMTVEEAHTLSHAIGDSLEEAFQIEIQALVHVEPYREACPIKIKKMST